MTMVATTTTTRRYNHPSSYVYAIHSHSDPEGRDCSAEKRIKGEWETISPGKGSRRVTSTIMSTQRPKKGSAPARTAGEACPVARAIGPYEYPARHQSCLPSFSFNLTCSPPDARSRHTSSLLGATPSQPFLPLTTISPCP